VRGAAWFHGELVPNSVPVGVSHTLDAPTTMAIWQLGNCERATRGLMLETNCVLGYFLITLLGSLGYRAVRDALPDNPAAQERITAATLTALAIADVGCPCVFSPHNADHTVVNLRSPSKLFFSFEDDLL
jgi:hypothetical protein